MTKNTPEEKTITIERFGVDIVLPRFDSLPLGIIRKSRKITDEIDRFFTIIEYLFEEGSEELNAIDKLSGEEEILSFMTEWIGTEEVSLGES
jgi:hypothetical protein